MSRYFLGQGKFRGFALALALCLNAPLLAAEKPSPQLLEKIAAAATAAPEITITAPEGMEFDAALNVYKGRHVTISRGELHLIADEISWNMDTQEAYATGNVFLHTPQGLSSGDSLFYDFKNNRARFLNFRASSPPYYFGGKTAEKIGNDYRITDGFFTTCDYDDPHWRLRARTIEVRDNKLIIARTVRLKLGRQTVFGFPSARRNMELNVPHWSITPGYRSKFGPFLLGTYNWDINNDFRTALHFDYRARRGPATGVDFQYKSTAFGRGNLETYYAYDDEGDDLQNRPLDYHRYRIHWDHRVEWPNNITATALVNKFSDNALEKDYFEKNFRENIQPDTFFELSKRAPNWTLSLLARPRINTFFTTTERLPELSLDAQRQPLFGSPLFYESETSLAHLQQSFADNVPNPDFNALRADTFHQLLYPHLYFGWLSLIPKAGIRGTFYSDAPNNARTSDGLGRFVANAGAETSFKIWRQWDTASERWNVEGLRHIFEPSAEYQYIHASRPPSDLFQFDTTFANSLRLPLNHLQPLSFPQFDQVDAIDSANVLRFGVRNKLQTQRDDQTWDLVDLNIFTEWHINSDYTTAPDEPISQSGFSDLFFDLKLRPTRWFGFRMDSRYDFHHDRLNELNTETRWLPTDWLNIGFATRFLDNSQTIFGNESNLFGPSIHIRFNEDWGFQMAHRFEAANGELEEQEYMIARDLHDWIISFTFRKSGDDIRAYIMITLKAFPARLRVG